MTILKVPSMDHLGLKETDPSQTYLDHGQRVWIGSKWDIVQVSNGYEVWRKGNYVTHTTTFYAAQCLVADDLDLLVLV